MNCNKISNMCLWVASFLLLSGCSMALLNFNEANKELHLRVIESRIYFDSDSSRLHLLTTINGKESQDSILAVFPKEQIDAYDSFLSNFLSKRVYSYNNETILFDTFKDNIFYGAKIQINIDSSLALLTISDAAALNSTQRTLFLLNLKLRTIRRIATFNIDQSYIERTVPFKSLYNRLFDIQCEAKWFGSTKFLLATNDGLLLYSLSELTTPKKLNSESVFSSFIPINNSVVFQNRNGVFKIDITTLTIQQISQEHNTFRLKSFDHYLFFIKGWSLYRINLDSITIVSTYKMNNLIKDFWPCDSNTVITRTGDLQTSREQNSFSRVDIPNEVSVLFEDTMGKLLDHYFSDDGKFFVVSKETIQLKTYHVFVVYDIASKNKYSFDFDSL